MKNVGLTLRWFMENAGALKIGAGLEELSGRKVAGVSTDSRTVSPGEIFVALAGDRFDGHDHVTEALKKGAMAVVVHRPVRGRAAALAINVTDTLIALGDLARALRRKQNLRVIALTGSNGKTTTKELLASILKLKDPYLLATKGNLNNQVGLPLTIFQVNKESRYAILEMGANHFGEIAYLTSLAEPQVGLITSVGAAHLEYFGSLARVAKAKGELFAGLGPDAVAVVDADEPLLVKAAKAFSGNKLYFGTGPEAQVRLGRVKAQSLSGQIMTLYGPGAEKGRQVKIKLLGFHNAHNALAAAATALAVGADWEQIMAGLERAEGYPGRLHALKTSSGRWLLDDSYNANPTSLAAGLKVLAEGVNGPKGAILGDMAELGPRAKKYHRDILALAAELKLDYLALVGQMFSGARAVAIKGGLPKENVAVFDRPEEAAAWVLDFWPSKCAVLVKGSRSMRLEKAVTFLKDND